MRRHIASAASTAALSAPHNTQLNRVTLCPLPWPPRMHAGLTYGFTALGDQTGTTLPAAFLEVPYNTKSPYYRQGDGRGWWRLGGGLALPYL